MAKTLTSINDVRGKNFQHLQLKFKIRIQIQDLKFPSVSLNSIEFTIKTVCQLSCIDSITENLENIGTICLGVLSLRDGTLSFWRWSFRFQIVSVECNARGKKRDKPHFSWPECKSLKAFGLYKRSKKSPHRWFACCPRSSKSAPGSLKRRPFTRWFLWHNSLRAICFARLAV